MNQTAQAEKTLQDLGVKYERRDDGTLYVQGDIMLYRKNLTHLPDLSCVHVGGGFWCFDNELTSLEGAPARVDGAFSCSSNKLTTLKGAPSYVGHNFYCEDNLLTTLEGAPAVVKGIFSCRENKLVSLKGAPSSFLGQFRCDGNPDLATLEGTPQNASIESDHGKFKSWQDIPEKLRMSAETREKLIAQSLVLQKPVRRIRRIKT